MQHFQCVQLQVSRLSFLGRGEKLEALELFHPERIAQRILGMGDVLSLVEEVEQKLTVKKPKNGKKIQKGGEFDLEDLLTQFQQMKNLGGMAGFWIRCQAWAVLISKSHGRSSS